jgi:hypothetical protein
VSYWKLDEASGTRADSFGGNNLTDNNGVGSASGVVGNDAVFVAAAGTYLSHASNSSLQVTGDFTFACWIKLGSQPSGSNAYSIITKDIDTGRDYTLDYSPGYRYLRFYHAYNGDVNTLCCNDTPLSNGTWYFVVIWYDATANKDYMRVNDSLLYGDPYTPGTIQTSTEFRIGSRPYPGYNDYFDGEIDEVGFWKRVLTSAEITSLYNGGAGVTFGGGGGVTAVVKPAIQRTATDALTTSDTASITRVLNRSATDAPVTAETINKAAGYSRTATDAPHTTEAATATRGAQSLTRTATDALATAETATGARSALSITRTTTEALATAEVAAKTATHSRTTTDNPVTAEAAAKAATHTRTTTDAPVTSEVASKTATHTRTATDSPVIAETATAIRTGAGVFARSTTDAPTTTEAATWKLVALRAAADAPRTTESATGVRLGLSISRTASDALATADLATGVRSPRTQTRTATDALATVDLATASKFGVVIRNATDALVANQVSNRILVAGRTTADAPTMAEAGKRVWIGARVATDMLTVVENGYSEGTAFLFIAGQVTGSTPYIAATGSKLRISSTTSALDITVAGSNVKAPRTGSQLAVEETT